MGLDTFVEWTSEGLRSFERIAIWTGFEVIRYIFFADKVEVEDITDKTHFFSLIGPHSHRVLDKLNLGAIKDQPYGTHMHYAVEGTPVTVGVGGGLAGPGYSFMLSTDTAGLVWEAIVDAGAVPMGSVAWEHLRVWQGRPVPGKELTDEFNALEAGLWKTISLTKGCYIGQETIARLITYDNVKQQLWGVHLDGPVQPNTVLYKEGVKVSKSFISSISMWFLPSSFQLTEKSSLRCFCIILF
jgi:folate-binding protein YgfZ